MLLDPSIEQGPSISESLESISTASLSDILQSMDRHPEYRDIFAEASRKAWHADSADLARCDLSEEHPHLFPKVGLRVIANWKRTAKGMTLAEIKESDANIPLFANRLSELIASVLGKHLTSGGYAIVTTPRRRHKERNFACLVAEAIGQRLQIPYVPDVAFAHNRQRINAEFTIGTIPREPNLIVFDDFVTTGSTMGAMNSLLAPLGKNLFFITGVDNQ